MVAGAQCRIVRGGVDLRLNDFLNSLDDVRRSGGGWTAKCPAHDDGQASLSVTEGDDGRILLNCFAGCGAESIVQSLGLQLKDLFPPGGWGVYIPPRTHATVQPVR